MAKLSPLAERLNDVRSRIAAACAKAKRDVSEVTLIAVTKTAGPEAIREIVSLGVHDLEVAGASLEAAFLALTGTPMGNENETEGALR